MTSTREHRNAGVLEDAVAGVGVSITLMEHVAKLLGPVLPDDYPTTRAIVLMDALRTVHAELTAELGI